MDTAENTGKAPMQEDTLEETPIGEDALESDSDEAPQAPEAAIELQPQNIWGKLFEAALFMSPIALSVSDLMNVVGSQNYTEVKNILLSFVQEFNLRDSALEILQLEDAFKMQVRSDFEPKVAGFAARQLFHQGIMKTLALIAFKQPIMQSAVIKYRNNKAYDHISRLVEEGFVARENKGRSFVLRTTKKFVEYFGEDFKKKHE